MALDGRHVDSWCTCGSCVVVAMVGDGESYAMHLGLEWFQCCDDANVADGATFWNMMKGDGLDGFRAFGT